MAEDGNSQKNQMSHTPQQETFQRAPEAQVEHRYPTHSTGIIALPPGSRGPRSLYLRRHGDSFGFTLRHFIVYPPDSIQDAISVRQAGVVANFSSPMDTIFVKNVAQFGPAEQAGLQNGDRIVAVNGTSVTNKSYAEVVFLIQRSPEYLHLLVVPKEEDILQKFFSETAHNPVSNQQHRRDLYDLHKDPSKFQRPLPQPPHSNEFHADALSWKSLQDAVYSSVHESLASRNAYRQKQQRSADNLLCSSTPSSQLTCHRNRSEEGIDESNRRPRAQPQVPIYRKMGRRASEGNTFSNSDSEQSTIYSSTMINDSNAMIVDEAKMKGPSKFVFPNTSPVAPRSNESTHSSVNYQNSIGCRLSLDGERRQSSASINSSLADGSKDSLSSYDSMSTLTGQDTDDSIIMTRLRKNLQQKEEFLRRPSHPVEAPTIQREFYGRPRKLDKPTWPPNEPVRQESPSKTAKPVHHNFQRVKADIETERDLGMHISSDAEMSSKSLTPQQKNANFAKEWSLHLGTMKEASPAPESLDNHGFMNGAASIQDEDRMLYLKNLQVVNKRARQFESGRPLPEDDPMFKDRTSFYKSELARISSKRVVPHVTIRAHEFESRSSEPRRDTSGSSTNSGLRRQHRDSRSLDSSGSNASSSSINEVAQNKLSGNVIIPFGSTQIHVPPPSESKYPKEQPQAATNETFKQDQTQISSPVIPKTIEFLLQNSSSAMPVISENSPPIRPNQLDLNRPIRPARRLQAPRSCDSSPRRCSSPVTSEENRPVVMRRIKNSNLGDEERAMRRESYLKATGNGRMQVDDFSDGEISPHVLRSAHRKWRPPLFPGDIQQLRKLFEDAAYSFGESISGGSSSSVSLERDKTSLPSTPLEKDAPTIREGLLHCKIAEIDGKRAGDRSWKQVWVILRGPKLFLHKDRHHQSPSDAAEQSLANGIDMSASCVRIAEDYTKRKHVLRVSSVLPCRSELLLQAENPVDFADWVKALQEQVASNNDTESKSNSTTKQQAVPQTTPAITTIQVQGSSRLSPQPHKSKLPSLRNRSPTGQSPVSKTRKPSQVNDGLVSPKTKTWRGRVAKQFRKIQGGSSPNSPTAPEGSTFGIPLELCYPSNSNQHVPKLVEVCIDIVEGKGLETIGVYRVPGNSAAITALTNSVNQSFDGVPQIDSQWNDVHVVSSLLKSFFRKLPDALLTINLYPHFIEADKIEDPNMRMEEIRKLVKCLPSHHYYTLRSLMLHLKKLTDYSEVNKMEAKNLAIVFGPTIIRGNEDDMASLVNDMTHNYKIVESLICYAEWFFSEDDVSTLHLRQPDVGVDSLNNEVASNRALLLDNISKVEGMKGEKAPGRELFSSIISAAHRKIRRGDKKSASQDSRDDLTSPNGVKEFITQTNYSNDLKQDVGDEKVEEIPTTVVDMEKSNKPAERGPWLNYSDQEQIRRRVENFIQETQANLQRNRRTAEFYGDGLEPRIANSVHHSSHENTLTAPNLNDTYTITKTQSASNVFHRPLNSDNKNTNLSNSALAVQYTKNLSELTDNKRNLQFNKNSERFKNYDLNKNNELLPTEPSGFQNNYSNRNSVAVVKPFDKTFLRRGSSAENINSSVMDLANNGTLKKIKYETENGINPRTGSLDSLHKLHEADDGTDLQASIMKIFDEKKRTLNPLLGVDLPFADESPERPSLPDYATAAATAAAPLQTKETNVLASPKIYRNPSLHKNSYTISKFGKTLNFSEFRLKEIQKAKLEEEKDRDCSEIVPDNDRHISNSEKLGKTNKMITSNGISSNSKLRRSESLNKPDRTVSPLNIKLKRSESLNKASDRLKRSDSLTKNEKTENNINKRRELSATRRTNKELTKLKRKNGMPERSIKRRHTVGGTKDFDKVNWLDNRYQDKDSDAENQNKEKCTLRTSSPDLSSTRRERLFLEVNLFASENIVVALRQHLIGVRPQSLPEPRIFSVPLESHV